MQMNVSKYAYFCCCTQKATQNKVISINIIIWAYRYFQLVVEIGFLFAEDWNEKKENL